MGRNAADKTCYVDIMACLEVEKREREREREREGERERGRERGKEEEKEKERDNDDASEKYRTIDVAMYTTVTMNYS